MTNPSSNLQGKTLDGKWRVVEKLGSQRGYFSSGYRVERIDNKEIGFLKALNYEYTMTASGTGIMSTDLIQQATEEFNYERDLYEFCRNLGIRGVIHSIDHGEHREAGSLPIPYIVLEFAEGGALERDSRIAKFDIEWRLRIFHGITIALRQLHNHDVVHKDIHTGNILMKGKGIDEEFLLGDLGKASKKGDSIYNAGKKVLVPYEYWYPDFTPSWEWNVACDCFGLGSFLYNLLTDSYISQDVFEKLELEYLPSRLNGSWSGPYNDIIPYLEVAHSCVISELEDEISKLLCVDKFNQRLRNIIYYLCHPNPVERSHEKNPRNLMASTDYSLERIISDADWLARMSRLA